MAIKTENIIRSKRLTGKIMGTDFAELFGTSGSDFSPKILRLIRHLNFRYRNLTQKERTEFYRKVLAALASNTFKPSGRSRYADWQRGWAENLKDFKKSKYDLNRLIPKYIRRRRPVRLFGDAVMPVNPKFELDFYTVYRTWLFEKYLPRAKAVYEFGCGTGYNLVIAAKMYPKTPFYGLDWARSSVSLINQIARAHRLKLEGIRFDMFGPDLRLPIQDKSVFITFNSLEQLGTNFKKLVDFFIKKKPMLCVHAEPFYELYRRDRLLDVLAANYHEKRNYLRGYLDYLRQLQASRRIKIIKIHRVCFGSVFHEGYSLCVWKPC
jgi:hypothetical protein